MGVLKARLTIPTVLLAALAASASGQENAWTSHGPEGVGWINDIAVGDAVYAATYNGVFRSTDDGRTWQHAGLKGEQISEVATLPEAGVFVLGQSGLSVSRDGGERWDVVSSLPAAAAAHITIDPRHRSTIYAGSYRELWRSTDAGATWKSVQTPPLEGDLLVAAFDSKAIFMSVYDHADSLFKLFRSADDGATWSSVSLPHQFSLVASGVSSETLYAVGENRFCQSVDSAATWTCSDFPVQYALQIIELPGGGGSAPRRILARADYRIYLSDDGGAHWTQATEGLPFANNVWVIASHPAGSVVLAGTDSSIARSVDRGSAWAPTSAGLHASFIHRLALDPRNPSSVWAVGSGRDFTTGRLQCGGLFRSIDAGLSWTSPGDPDIRDPIRALLVDAADPSTLYGGGSFGVAYSEDGGLRWATVALPGDAGVAALTVDPAMTGRIWAATSRGLFQSSDGARSWLGNAALTKAVSTILFDPHRPGTIYAGSYFKQVESSWDYPPRLVGVGGSIFVSEDGGARFTKIPHDFISVESIVADPIREGVLYVLPGDGGGFRIEIQGTSLKGPVQKLSDFDGIYSLVADPVRLDHLYASTQFGIYRTVDGGRTWEQYSSGLRSLQPGDLVATPDGRWLHAGTAGGGVFDLDLEAAPPPRQRPRPLPPRNRPPRPPVSRPD
jgi:photosystem II stability/assembly factor-like uncharacterized protein